MATRLTDLETQILTKNKAEVEALLGKPVKIGYWTTPASPQGASAAETATFEARLDEIWIYFSGRVHFSIAGSAVKVDNRTNLDLPPEQNFDNFV